MSTHRHVRAALDRAVEAHRRAHRDHLAAAGLEEHTEATVSPLGPAGDMGSDTGAEDA
jgi:hypothetical protein